MSKAILKTIPLTFIGVVAPVLVISFAIIAVALFQDRMGSASIPILTAGMFLVLICVIAVIFTTGRIRQIITQNDKPILGRLSPKKIIVLFGLVIPAIFAMFFYLVNIGWIAQPTTTATGTIYSVLLSFCTMWMLIGITEKYGGL
ncbi:MAG: hypothetical protein EB829_05530 [Nitrosopumilus sp. H8]|nr:MAG: hypothetical protein EB829_05530 [Nitrosopumilus sp. H8]